MKINPHKNIPENAKCVFDGIRCQVFQWEQTLYDNTKTTFERILFASWAFVLAILKNWNILITKQEQPGRDSFFSLPGGGIEKSDLTPLDAAKRELFEETGAKSEKWKHWIHFDGTANVVTSVDYFIAQDCEIIAEITPDAWEKIEKIELSFDEFLALSSDERFHHHWNLLPMMYEARLHHEKYEELKSIIFWK